MAALEARMPHLSGRFSSLSFTTYSNFFSARRTPPINNFSPIFRCHSCPKSMRIFSFSLMWLIRSLHFDGLFVVYRLLLTLLTYKNNGVQTRKLVQ
jgi:hypothetical protein